MKRAICAIFMCAASAASFACGASDSGSASSTGGAPASTSTSTSSSSDGPAPFVVIEPSQARLLQAAQGLKAKIGHEVTVDMAPELQQEHADHVVDALAAGLEAIGRGIDRARVMDPGQAARAVATLASIHIELDEKARNPYVVYDDRAASLTLRLPTRATEYASDEDIAAALAAPAPAPASPSAPASASAP